MTPIISLFLWSHWGYSPYKRGYKPWKLPMREWLALAFVHGHFSFVIVPQRRPCDFHNFHSKNLWEGKLGAYLEDNLRIKKREAPVWEDGPLLTLSIPAWNQEPDHCCFQPILHTLGWPTTLFKKKMKIPISLQRESQLVKRKTLVFAWREY